MDNSKPLFIDALSWLHRNRDYGVDEPPRPESGPVHIPPSNHKEWVICLTGYPEGKGGEVKLSRDWGIYKLCSRFLNSDHCQATLHTTEVDGITKYIYKVGWKQYNQRIEITKEAYDYIKQRVEEIKKEDSNPKY